jgi:hypothetical protein
LLPHSQWIHVPIRDGSRYIFFFNEQEDVWGFYVEPFIAKLERHSALTFILIKVVDGLVACQERSVLTS